MHSLEMVILSVKQQGSIQVSGKLLNHPSLGLGIGLGLELELTQTLWRGGWVVYQKPGLIQQQHVYLEPTLFPSHSLA